jgi:hypothetical protein
MVNFTIDQLRGVMDKKHNIRNMSVIGKVSRTRITLVTATANLVTDIHLSRSARGPR